MGDSWTGRRWVTLTIRMLIVLIAIMAVGVTGLAIIGSHLRGPLVRFYAAQTGRRIRVAGGFDAYLFSLHPRVVAERVTIGNPPWTPPGVTAEIGRLSITYDLPWFGQELGIRKLQLEQATLALSRDEAGRANWQFREPGTGDGQGPPLIRSLSMPDAHVRFDDERRHLNFEGTVSAREVSGRGSAPPLRVDGAGNLNGRTADFTINGDPLATVSRGKPYLFEFSGNSSGSRLTGKGSLPHPFDFRMLETTFEAVGEDMRDLYFLTGVRLPDTGTYHLAGKFTRRGLHFEFSELDATSGRSDLRGSVSIEADMTGPSHIEADLHSQALRMSDLGAKAAGRAPKTDDAGRMVLPDTAFQFGGVRRSDASVNFHAQALEAGHVSLRGVGARIRIDDGVIKAAPVSAALREGKITGELKLDVSRDVPAADIDLKIANLKLGELVRNRDASREGKNPDPPPLDGPLQARVTLKGHGSSIHEIASNANGTVTAVLPHGALRASLAEVAGLDLRALGLMAAADKEDTGIRCGVASFQLQGGTLTSQRLVIDTEPVLITGTGTIDLDSEALDLRFEGKPKHPRLRVRAPLLVRGTLAHPSFSLEARKPAAQAGEAIALGVLLTPVAAMLAFVDPGLAKDMDCAALLADAQEGAK